MSGPDYSAIATESGIQPWELEIAAGQRPLKKCLAETLQKAKAELKSAMKGSEDEYAAKLRCNELALNKVREANNSILKIKEAYAEALAGEAKIIAMAMWEEDIIQRYEAAKEPNEAEAAFKDAPRESPRSVKRKALAKWDDICLELAELATVFPKAMEAASISPKKGRGRQAALMRAVELSKTLTEVKSVLKETEIGTPARDASLLRLIELSEI